MNQSDYDRSPFVRVGVVLMSYWVFAIALAIFLQLRQPEQLGIPEAYIYHAFVAYPLAWAFLLGAALVGAGNSGSQWPRVLGRSVTIIFLASVVLGLFVGWLSRGTGWNIVYNMLFTSFFSPPPELLVLGLGLWAVREV